MKKPLLRYLALALVVFTLAALLIGCAKPFTCDICREEKTGKKHTEKVLGQEIVYCDDCYKQLQKLGDLFQ